MRASSSKAEKLIGEFLKGGEVTKKDATNGKQLNEKLRVNTLMVWVLYRRRKKTETEGRKEKKGSPGPPPATCWTHEHPFPATACTGVKNRETGTATKPQES